MIRCAHRVSTLARHRSQRLFAVCVGAMLGLSACAEPLACTDTEAGLRTPMLVPGLTQQVAGLRRDRPMLLEEAGSDIEFRTNSTAEFQKLETPPNRLGFTVVAAGFDQLEVRIAKGQGSARIRIQPCLSRSDALFFAGLADAHKRFLRAGVGDARAASPALQWLARVTKGLQQAWLLNTYANVRLSAGEPLGAAAAFLASRDAWRAHARADRSATALMAAGESLSRAGRFDEAAQLLRQAGNELRASGLADFALRSDGALCTIASRRGLLDESVECESRVITLMERQGNHQEAATRHISLGNLLFRLGRSAAAREHFDAADRYADVLTPVVAARLHKAHGTYSLFTGDIPGAAREFGAASARLMSLGHPAEGAEIDLKLASLAMMAGASLERQRLLERAATTLHEAASPALLATTLVGLADTRLQRGDAAGALTDLQSARDMCQRLDKRDCLDHIMLLEIEAQLALGNTEAAGSIHRRLLGTRDDTSLGHVRAEVALASALIDLAAGRPAQSTRKLPPADWVSGDPQLEAERAILQARADLAIGDFTAAAKVLDAHLQAQAQRASEWPSAALRLSARNRLAKLQKARFDVLASSSPDTLDDAEVTAIARAVSAVSVRGLFRTAASAELPLPVRNALSAAIETNTAIDQRELFLALASQPPPVPQAEPKTAAGLPDAPLRGWILLPLAGTSEFRLLAIEDGKARVCRHWPLQRYDTLAADFELALDGRRDDVLPLEAAAADWNDAISQCLTTPYAQAWTVVATPGTRPLPWAWIAASGPATRAEPTVTTVFELPEHGDVPVSPPATVALIDLDMARAAPLPFARKEREALLAQFNGRRVTYTLLSGTTVDSRAILRTLAAADLAHVIGHANPAAFGQIYQGLWFESGGRPTLLSYPEIAASPMDAKLVVLSACGTDAAAATNFGATSRLAEAFIAAGAHRVIAASNPLSDSAAPHWTKAFYESLWASGDAAVAARDARLVLRRSPHFRHPKYWAGIEFYRGADRDRAGASVHELHRH